jgi:acetyl esterase/lipase
MASRGRCIARRPARWGASFSGPRRKAWPIPAIGEAWRMLAIVLAASAAAACAPSSPPGAPDAAPAPVTWEEIAALPVPPADHRIHFGSGRFQFGDLRLPEGAGPHPVVVVIHGGCWRNTFDLEHISPLSATLTENGIATWTIEYRRIGDPGGGWPGTFEDVAAGIEHLDTLAPQFALDTDQVLLLGHSAGGHLALWWAGRYNLSDDSRLRLPGRITARGIVSLAGIADLRSYGAGEGGCNRAVAELLGGSPQEVPGRYAQACPVELLPLGVPQRLVHGVQDPIVPIAESERLADRAVGAGDDARVVRIEGAGHFDVIAPFAPAWHAVLAAVRELLDER